MIDAIDSTGGYLSNLWRQSAELCLFITINVRKGINLLLMNGIPWRNLSLQDKWNQPSEFQIYCPTGNSWQKSYPRSLLCPRNEIPEWISILTNDYFKKSLEQKFAHGDFT